MLRKQRILISIGVSRMGSEGDGVMAVPTFHAGEPIADLPDSRLDALSTER